MKLPWSIAEAHGAITAGTLKPSELVAECLRRINRWDAKTHAWVVVDRQRPGRGAPPGSTGCRRSGRSLPLAGIPLGIKDIFDVAGLPTRAGSPLSSAEPAAHDAACVARLRAAGGIILGKTVTAEFAYINPPATRNPWDLEHTPGGSSSGSAVAVALGMCLGALGSQTGGSIIRPAAYCGVSGFKPSFGRIDRTGVLVSSPTLDQVGALARRASDLETMWQVMADPQPQAAHPPAAAEHAHVKHHLLHLHRHAEHEQPADHDSGFPHRAHPFGDCAAVFGRSFARGAAGERGDRGLARIARRRSDRGDAAGRLGRNLQHAPYDHGDGNGPISSPAVHGPSHAVWPKDCAAR